jgi:hypothetical protein
LRKQLGRIIKRQPIPRELIHKKSCGKDSTFSNHPASILTTSVRVHRNEHCL